MTNDLPEKVELRGYVDSRLRDLVVAEAEAKGIPVSEVVAVLVAQALGRPDLGVVPRRWGGGRRPVRSTKKGKSNGK